MEMKKTIWNFISVFLITVLIIAVLRGKAWLYIAAFIVWAAWVMTFKGINGLIADVYKTVISILWG